MNEINKHLLNYPVKLFHIQHNISSKPLNEQVAKIFVINLVQNEKRRNYILTLFNKYNIDFTLVLVEKIHPDAYAFVQQHSKISTSEAGCLFSHLWCLRYIINNEYPNAIILEDDIIFHKNFVNLCLKKIESKPDFLLLGACDFSFRDFNSSNIEENGLYFPSTYEKMFGAHANYYSLKGAKRMYALKTKQISFFDNNYIEMFCSFPRTSGICYPNLVVSDITTSDLNHSYMLLSKKEELYYSRCFKEFCFTDYNFIYIQLFDKNYVKFESKSYEEYIDHILDELYHNEENAQLIKNRLVLDFFNMDDVKAIMMTH
jgi:GR25 family glycosyltransferase involved in LPS biosynthesis